MIVALDVGYSATAEGEAGLCAVVAFADWEAADSEHELVAYVDTVHPYVSGRLFERELPCLIAGLDALSANRPDIDFEVIIVDGNVRLDQSGRAGLGLYLYRHLAETIPIVGVAKTAFAGLDAVEVLRGDSTKPLYVTAVGLDETEAAQKVTSMAGAFRMPTMLRRADQLTRHRPAR